MFGFLLRWSMNLLALVVASSLIDGIRIQSIGMGILAAGLLSIVNTVIRPIVLVLTLPITIVTLGLFTFVINAMMLLLVDAVISGLTIESFRAAFWGALIVSMVSWILNGLIGGDAKAVVIKAERRGGRDR